MISPTDIVKGRALLIRGAGGDPIATAQAEFTYLWGKLPHLLPPISDHIRDQVNGLIAKEINELLTQ